MTLEALVAESHRWNHMDGWGGGWMWLWGSLMMIAIVAAAAVIARSAGSSRNAPPSTAPSGFDRARDILAERYANGELTTEEYRARLAELDRNDVR